MQKPPTTIADAVKTRGLDLLDWIDFREDPMALPALATLVVVLALGLARVGTIPMAIFVGGGLVLTATFGILAAALAGIWVVVGAVHDWVAPQLRPKPNHRVSHR